MLLVHLEIRESCNASPAQAVSSSLVVLVVPTAHWDSTLTLKSKCALNALHNAPAVHPLPQGRLIARDAALATSWTQPLAHVSDNAPTSTSEIVPTTDAFNSAPMAPSTML